METQLIGPERKEEWEGFISRHPLAIAWQSYSWSDVLARHYDYGFYPFAAVDQSGIRGLLPLYLVGARGNGRP